MRLEKIFGYLPSLLIPNVFRNIYLSLRFRSLVSPKARIYHSSRLRIGKKCLVDECLIDANTDRDVGISIGDGCLIHTHTVLRAMDGYIEIGDNVAIQNFCSIYGFGETRIGRDTLIASHCAIGVVRHNFSERNIPIASQGWKILDTFIEENVWIGSHVTVFSGLRIGKGSIIGAGAVVSKDIPPYSIAVGVPAKVIRER